MVPAGLKPVVEAEPEGVWTRVLTFPMTGRMTLTYRTSAPRVAGSMTGDERLCWDPVAAALTPDDEQALEDKPHGDPVEDSSEAHGLGEVERAEDDLMVSSNCSMGKDGQTQ